MTYQDARGAAGMQEMILRHLGYTIGKDAAHATLHDVAHGAEFRRARPHRGQLVRLDPRPPTRRGAKRVYYLSMEFLIGRLLGDALVNLRVDAEAKAAIEGLGLDFDAGDP